MMKVLTFERRFLADNSVLQIGDPDTIEVVRSDVERTPRNMRSTKHHFYLVLAYRKPAVIGLRAAIKKFCNLAIKS